MDGPGMEMDALLSFLYGSMETADVHAHLVVVEKHEWMHLSEAFRTRPTIVVNCIRPAHVPYHRTQVEEDQK